MADLATFIVAATVLYNIVSTFAQQSYFRFNHRIFTAALLVRIMSD
jgi:hypothetical protein